MTILIHHNADNDGLACAAIFKHRFPNGRILGWDYPYKEEDLIPALDQIRLTGDVLEDDLYIADISFSLELMEELCDEFKSVTWIDHHKSAWNDYEEHIMGGKNSFGVVYDHQISACELTWKYFYPEREMPHAIMLLGMYDTWRREDEDLWDCQIMPYQTVRKMDFSIDAILEDMKNARYVDMSIEQGQIMLKRDWSHYKMIARKAVLCSLLDEPMYVVNTPIGQSNIPELLYDENAKTVCCWYFDGEMYRYSLRSAKDGPDVSEIARVFGGGGHKHAAGFSHVDCLIFEKIS